jgi:hypothetical protein
VTPEGLAAEVHIDVLPGSYAPEFRYAGAPKEEGARDRTPEPAALLLVGDKPRPRRRNVKAITVGAFLVLAAASAFAVLKWAGASTGEEGFRRFWEPVYRSSDPLLLAVANPLVYHPSARANRLNAASQPPQSLPVQRPLHVEAKLLDGSDLIPVPNQYVGYGDMVVATEVAGMLGRKNKPVRVRLASSVQFADFRQGQTLLVGAITNHWTLELGQAWRFQFARDPNLEYFIFDTQDRTRQWHVPSGQDGSAAEDYILICRIRNSITGGFVIVAAGVKQFGTEAAGRLLTDPAQFSSVLAKLPHGWEDKNLQIVLHAKVIGNTPGQPDLVAWHVW